MYIIKGIQMPEIIVFKTHCLLPDGSKGEVCKKGIGNVWLVCNNKDWWGCETEYILNNLCEA